jgi:hypothetical protein
MSLIRAGLCQPRRLDGASPGARDAGGTGAARIKRARLYRWLLDLLLVRDSRLTGGELDDPRPAWPVHTGAARLCESINALVRNIRLVTPVAAGSVISDGGWSPIVSPHITISVVAPIRNRFGGFF